MRIGLVCPYSLDVAGGVQAHVLGLADHLREQGHAVSVLAPAANPPAGVVSAGRAVPIRYNGSVARLTFGPATRVRVSRWLRDGVDGAPFDLLHLHEPMTPSCASLALFAAEVPLVATFHTCIGRSRAMSAARPFFAPALEKIGARVAVSREAGATLTRHVGRDATIIPNGVRTADFAAAPDPRWRGTPGRPTLVFLGRATEPRKGLAVLLAALPALLARHPGLRLLVAGHGGAEVHVPGTVASAVEILGPLPDAERAALLASADVFVAPNTGGESFGIILVEAMAAGAPIVASDLVAFADVVGQDAGRLFRTGDPDDLADVVTGLLADPMERAGLARAGRRRATRYDWATIGEHVNAVYETVLLASPIPAVPVRTPALTRPVRALVRAR